VFILSRVNGDARSGANSRRPARIPLSKSDQRCGDRLPDLGFLRPEAAGGCRHDDLAFDIAWPAPVAVISERDLGWPPLSMSTP